MQELSLSELNLQIQKTLEEQLDASYWVVAEIAQLQVNQSGHCYIELVQKSENKVIAKARATIWAYSFRNISAWFEKITGSSLTAGMRILANAKVTFHEVYGLSLNIKDIDPSFTLGEREKARQEVIHQLEADGIMEMNKGLELPTVPQNIAIISSETAAGYEDFINQLTNNSSNYAVNYRFFPAMMQGEKAPESIINTLHKINELTTIDLVVLIRGGGSQLDLDCFDDYDLCSHIAQFPIPVLTGIGHERDTSIADMVSHTSLKTPTAVAEFILQGFGAFELNIEDLFNTISSISKEYITIEKEGLHSLASSIIHSASQNFHTRKSELDSINQFIKHRYSNHIIASKNNLDSIEQKIRLLNPQHILDKGYSLTYINGKLISENKIKKGDKIETINASQKINSTVDKAINTLNHE